MADRGAGYRWKRLRRIVHLFVGHPHADCEEIPMGRRCRCGAEFGRWDYP